MSMGIGTNAQHPDEGEITRKLDAVACGVWFTSKGANVKHFFTLLGKMFFTPYGKEFFTYPGKQIFTS